MKIRFLTLLATFLLSSMAGAQIYDANTLTNGLVAWYPLHGNTIESARRENQGDIVGAKITYGIANVIDSAFDFDGANSYIDFKITDIPYGDAPRTVSIWLKSSQPNNDYFGCVFNYGGFPYAERFGLHVHQSRPYFVGEAADFIGNANISNNLWHAIVVTYDGSAVRMYVDGSLDSACNLKLATTQSIFRLGARTPGDNLPEFFNGSLSNLRIYNRALSPDEVAELYAMESTPPAPPTTTDTFGSGANQFRIDFVTVGNPGNSNDTTGYGGVPYSYRIGKYTISQNQVDAATRNGLRNVTSAPWSGDQPAANISWYQAAAYVNWLNTSQGYHPAYNLTFTNGAWSMALWPTSPDINGNVAWTLGGTNSFRNALCHYFLPSENEWYKAAYYDPNKNGGSGGYWLYPTGSDTAPTPVASGTATGTAVFNNATSAPSSVFQAGGLSPYGTMGQGGNAWQWFEVIWNGSNTDPNGDRGTGQGAWDSYSDTLKAFNRGYAPPNSPGRAVGFRVASVDDTWLSNGLVGYYPLHSDANDYSGNGNNGTVYKSTFTNDRYGNVNSAYGFSNSYITITNAPQLYLTNDFSINFSFNAKEFPTTLSPWCGLMGARNTYDTMNWELYYSVTVPCLSFAVGPGNNWSWGSAAFQLQTNSWYTETLTRKGSIFSVYVNGELISTTDSHITIPTGSAIVLGQLGLDGHEGIVGSMNNVRFYNRALSSNEVAQLYALESIPPPVIPHPTIATQPFDQSISLGQNTSFTIEATGTGPFSYQWLKDGMALTNQTNASLVVTNAQSNAVGYYSCTVTDANSNSVTSSNAALNISGVPFWLWQGLVAYYQFNGTFNDYAGNLSPATNNGSFFSANRFGKSNGAVGFTGSQYTTITGLGSILSGSKSGVTVAFWCFATQDFFSGFIQNDFNNPTISPAIRIGVQGDGNILYGNLGRWGSYPGNDIPDLNSPTHFSYGAWHQITGVINVGSVPKFYLDGVLCSLKNVPLIQSQPLVFDCDYCVGTSWEGGVPMTGNGYAMHGRISDLRFYNRALSSNEVAALYALESTPPGPTNSQSISFPAIPTQTLTNGAYPLGATADSGLPVSYAIGDSTVAGITNGTLIPLGVGTTTVVASQAGDTNYLPATPVTNTLVVTLAQQVVAPSPVATRTYGSLPFGLTLPTNASGLPITARIVSGPATLSGTNIILTGTGTVTLAYDVPGNALYAPASVTNTFTVTNALTNLRSQTITFKPLAAKAYGSAPQALAGSASSKLPVTYWSSNTNVAVINGTNAIITGAGSTVITAYQSGDGSTFNPAAPVSQTLLVNQSSQKLTLKAPKSIAYGSTPAAISATSSSGLPVTLTSSDATIATITNSGTNSLLVPTGVGTITLTATQAGNTNVGAAIPVGQSIVISPGIQTITFAALGTNTYGALPISLTATSSAGLPVNFTSSATNVAAISGNTLTITGAGSAKITASQAGSKLWAPAQAVTQPLTVAKASQSIRFSTPSTVTFTNGGLVTLGATATSGLPVAYKSGNSKVLSITGSTCVITGKGTTTVVASQPGGTNYLPATAITNTITVQ